MEYSSLTNFLFFLDVSTVIDTYIVVDTVVENCSISHPDLNFIVVLWSALLYSVVSTVTVVDTVV